MSTAKFDTLQNAAGSKSVPVATVVDGSAKAWVNFNGTGVVAIRAAFNVTSITDGGVGTYTINFTTAMTDANFSCVGAGRRSSAAQDGVFSPQVGTATNSVNIVTSNAGGQAEDFTLVNAAIFR